MDRPSLAIMGRPRRLTTAPTVIMLRVKTVIRFFVAITEPPQRVKWFDRQIPFRVRVNRERSSETIR